MAEVVERFTDAQADFLSVRVRFVAAADRRWRYAVYKRLSPIGTGPQGQQVWHSSVEDADDGHQPDAGLPGRSSSWANEGRDDQRPDGEVRHDRDAAFTGGLQRDGAVGLGFQPKAEKLRKGVVLRISPLLTYDGDTLDAAIEL